MRRLSLLVVVACAAAAVMRTGAQVRPIYDRGAAGLTHALLALQTTGSVLHIGAHPDDEDSAFLARVARGDHARVAYLSLNRGEGGQNLIGPELFDALGVIRTEELLQARRLDGGQQFFSRTFDYGFSKTLVEAKAKWNEREALADVVRVIRLFRPLVIYARWTGTPSDGHGQHQFAGYLAPLAFKAAADATQFPEQVAEGLNRWQTKKFYQGVGFGANQANAATLQVQTGVFDAVLGRTYREIAIEGRSQHKTQETGAIEPLGPGTSGLRLRESMVEGREASLFDGMDVTIGGLSRLAGLPESALKPELQAIDAAVRQAIDGYRPLNPERIVPPLVAGLRAVRAARVAARSLNASMETRADADFLLAIKEEQFVDVLTRAASIVVDPLADVETVVPGGGVNVTVRTFLAPTSPAKVVKATVAAPPRWQVTTQNPSGPSAAAAGGGATRETPSHQATYRIAVPANAPPTQPYYLQQRRQGDMYEWIDSLSRTLPFDPPLLRGIVTLEIEGTSFDVVRPVEFRFADPVRGELRRDVNVVPSIAVGVDPKLLIVPTGKTTNQQRVIVRATSYSRQPMTGTLRLRLPEGWTSTPAAASFTLSRAGEGTPTPFTISAPATRSPGVLEIAAEGVVNGTTFDRDVQEIAYPHIQTHRLYWPATLTARVLDVNVAPIKVGYVMGSGDEVPEALEHLGVAVTFLDDEALATGDLSSFDTIVVGIRASEARPAFVANHARLIRYVEEGGTLIVQYQQGDYVMRNLPPFPVGSATNSRVVDEAAPVRILAPRHPLMTFPNTITEADFAGWVQERNLWAFVNFDPRYTPLLETADLGEPPQRGGEVYAQIGKGYYVYTAFAWFRQLPAGVPGAYRQFANLVSLPKAPR
jgi:LmbE family N-acetylglucosaminyl deacetylase